MIKITMSDYTTLVRCLCKEADTVANQLLYPDNSKNVSRETSLEYYKKIWNIAKQFIDHSTQKIITIGIIKDGE